MSALHSTPSRHPDEKIKAGKLGATMTKAGIGIAVVFLVVSIVLVIASDPEQAKLAGHASRWARFFNAYVIGWLFIFSIALGCLWLILLHHLVRGRWATVVRRIAEAVAGAMPIVFIAGLGFIIPLLAGYQDLYYWAHSDARDIAIQPHMHHKLGWLDPTFFSIRFIVYGVIFSAMAAYFAKKSRQQDDSGDPKLSEHMRIAAGPGMVVFALTTSAVAFDVLMSLAPKWYSTIYGVNFWGSACIGGFAVLGLLVLGIQRSGRLVHSINAEHYHDIGKWLFAFTFFWAYTAFSQFMLQWYGNMPEETVWYKYRLFGEWQWVSIAILVGYWAFPFVFLLSRWTKRIVPSLVFFCVWQFVFHWLDIYWNAMPAYDWQVSFHEAARVVTGPYMGNTAYHHVGFSPIDVTVWIGLCGVLLAAIGRNLTGNLIPIKDPTLGLSLAHEVQ